MHWTCSTHTESLLRPLETGVVVCKACFQICPMRFSLALLSAVQASCGPSCKRFLLVLGAVCGVDRIHESCRLAAPKIM